MLSINYISNFLSNRQDKISKIYYDRIKEYELNKEVTTLIPMQNIIIKTDQYKLNLYESFNMLFNKSTDNFYYDNKIYHNKSKIFSLLNSFLLVGNEYFNLNNEKEKTLLIKEFIIKMDSELFQKDLYNKFEYDRNKNFNKSNIQEALKNAIQLKDSDNLHLLKTYLSDYLGVNIYIFHVNNKVLDIENSEYYLSKYYNSSKYLPHFMILYENETYNPILMKDSSYSILKYSNDKDIIDIIFKYFKIDEIDKINQKETEKDYEKNKYTESKFNLSNLKKMKIDEIKNLCNENNISLLKKSEKTLKMINKLKDELIIELLKI